MRLFIASPVVLDDFVGVQKSFEGIVKGRWVKEESLHLTWKFLGEHEQVVPIVSGLRKLSPLQEPSALQELGFFGKPARILYAKTEDESFFYAKAKMFEKAGFKMDRFKPHVTLCRMKQIVNFASFRRKVASFGSEKLGYILPELILYESVLTPQGAKYRVIEKVL